MKANTTNENPVYACMSLFGRKPLHPMMGLARLDETKSVRNRSLQDVI